MENLMKKLSSYNDIVDWLDKTASNNDDFAIREILEEAAEKIRELLSDEVSNLSSDDELFEEKLESYGLSEYRK